VSPDLVRNVRYVDRKLAETPDSEQSREIVDHVGELFEGTVSFDRLARECADLAKKQLLDPYDALEHGGGVLTFS
jgi:hypothetical protein